MGRFDSAPVTVPIGPCECPGTPHEQDEVYLRPRLGYQAGADASVAFVECSGIGGDRNALAKLIVPIYVRGGAVGWNLLDADGEPLSFDPERILDDWNTAVLVGEKADSLYSEAVVDPLVRMASPSSRATPTKPSTSARKRSSRSNPKPSSRSSSSTTTTDGIVTISPSSDGDSRRSPRRDREPSSDSISA